MLMDLINEASTVVKVVTWCRQQGTPWANVDPYLEVIIAWER